MHWRVSDAKTDIFVFDCIGGSTNVIAAYIYARYAYKILHMKDTTFTAEDRKDNFDKSITCNYLLQFNPLGSDRIRVE